MKSITFYALIFLTSLGAVLCKIRCPKGISRFSASGPSPHVNDPSYYYDCTSTSYAKLQRCRNGTIYYPETETCILSETPSSKNLTRVKRAGEQTGGTTKTLKSLTRQPTLGRNVILGSLYYGPEDRIDPAENLWKQNKLKANAFKTKNPSSKTKIEITQNTLDRINLFDIDASLALSFMGGLVKVSGSAGYLNDRRKQTNSVSVSLSYDAVTEQETITQELKNALDFPDLCNKVGKTNGPTHVVTAVTRGFRGVFHFIRDTKDETSNSQVAGSLSVVIKTLPSIQIEGDASVNVTEKEKTLYKNVSCSFNGDTILEDSPTNMEEAIVVYKKLQTIARVSTNIIYYDLSPITDFCDEKVAILNSISLNNINRVKDIIQDMERTELKADYLSNSQTALIYGQTLGKTLKNFIKELRKFKNNWIQELQQLLPNVRGGGGKTETELVELINSYEVSAYEYESSKLFLKNRQRELQTVALAIDRKNPGIVIEEAGNANGNKCLFKSTYAVQYILYVLPKNNIVEEYISLDTSTGTQWSEQQRWFWSDSLVPLAGEQYRQFREFYLANQENDKICFLVRLKHVEEDSNPARISVDETGQRVESDFQPPMKLNIPDRFVVSYNKIIFRISYPSDSVTNYIHVKYWKQWEQDNDARNIDTKFFTISSDGNTTITLENLEANTNYGISFSAGPKWGHGPYSEEYGITTNAFSAPTSFKVVNKTDNSFKLSWKRPLDIATNFTIERYRISVLYHKNKEEVAPAIEIDVDSSEDDYNADVTNLASAQRYDIIVEGINTLIGTTPSNLIREDARVLITDYTQPSPLNAPNIGERSQHTMSVLWEPPTKIAQGSHILFYQVKYFRIDPSVTGKPLILGSEHTQTSTNNRITLKDLAAGGTYEISVMVKSSAGESAYSRPTIGKTLELELTELDRLRDSLNIQGEVDNINKRINDSIVGLTSDVFSNAEWIVELLHKTEENRKHIDRLYNDATHLLLYGGWNFYKIKVHGKMTDANVKATCEKNGFVNTCVGSSGCSNSNDQCVVTSLTGCGRRPMSEISKKMCNGKGPDQCSLLDGVYAYMGNNLNSGSACGVEGSSWCANGNNFSNKWALCASQ